MTILEITRNLWNAILPVRYIRPNIEDDLKRKMVFVGGPRQVGKTRLSLSFLDPPTEANPAYLNWDTLQDQQRILSGGIPVDQNLVVLDEIHKFARWRNWVKGLYDKHRSTLSVLVTGSARLDYYRKGGDSLQGRYHYYRLHPFSLRELQTRPSREDLRQLLKFGGFPEPLLAQSERAHRRWQRERIERVIREDLRDLERVREVSLISLLLEHLPACVGSPLSVNSLRELLQVAHATTEHWIAILERLYMCFRISPYGPPKIRAVKKEQKLYFWDWSQVPSIGARFENLVASQLLKYCHFVEDTEGYRMELRYLRDTDAREVDFVVMKDRKPEFAVECKVSAESPPKSMSYFKERADIPEFFLVHTETKDYLHAPSGIRVLPFWEFCDLKKLP